MADVATISIKKKTLKIDAAGGFFQFNIGYLAGSIQPTRWQLDSMVVPVLGYDAIPDSFRNKRYRFGSTTPMSAKQIADGWRGYPRWWLRTRSPDSIFEETPDSIGIAGAPVRPTKFYSGYDILVISSDAEIAMRLLVGFSTRFTRTWPHDEIEDMNTTKYLTPGPIEVFEFQSRFITAY